MPGGLFFFLLSRPSASLSYLYWLPIYLTELLCVVNIVRIYGHR